MGSSIGSVLSIDKGKIAFSIALRMQKGKFEHACRDNEEVRRDGLRSLLHSRDPAAHF